VQFLLPMPLQACKDLRGSKKKINHAKPAQNDKVSVPAYLLLLFRCCSCSRIVSQAEFVSRTLALAKFTCEKILWLPKPVL
jgi:hypothetical protein